MSIYNVPFLIMVLMCAITFNIANGTIFSTTHFELQNSLSVSELEYIIKKPLLGKIGNIEESIPKKLVRINENSIPIPKDGDYNLWRAASFFKNNQYFTLGEVCPGTSFDQRFEIITSRNYRTAGRRYILDKKNILRGVIGYGVVANPANGHYYDEMNEYFDWLRTFGAERINTLAKNKKSGILVIEMKYGYVMFGYFGPYPNSKYNVTTYIAFIDKGYIRDPQLPQRKSSLPNINLNNYLENTVISSTSNN